MPPKPKQDPSVIKWLTAKANVEEQAKPLIQVEQALRKLVIQKFFPRPRENTNIADCGVGALNLNQPYKRSIDEALLESNKAAMLQAGIPVDDVFIYYPKINMEAYRALTVAQRKKVDRCLSITLDSPTLKFIEDPVT